jgi:hypothetical protein
MIEECTYDATGRLHLSEESMEKFLKTTENEIRRGGEGLAE